MKIVIASGKGGTGKTTVAVNLAYYLNHYLKLPLHLLDCDVEAPNCNLFLNAEITEKRSIQIPRPHWDKSSCQNCGKCVEVCKYNALALVKDQLLVFNELCRACGACFHVCKSKALSPDLTEIGQVQIADKQSNFYFARGILKIRESLAPRLIQEVKQLCHPEKINIIDAPPGTACSVVKTIEGADVIVLVTEPTPFGLHDLKLAVALAFQANIPVGVVINRNNSNQTIIKNFCDQVKIPIIGEINYQVEYARAYAQGKILLEKFIELVPVFEKIFRNIQLLKKEKTHRINSLDFLDDFQVTPTEPSSPPQNESIVTEQTHPCKEITVISGKGGTGKTTIVSALAKLFQNLTLTDNDVDAANLHLLLKPSVYQKSDFYGMDKFCIDSIKCNSCGLCKEKCAFTAIIHDKANDRYQIHKELCEGCGFCHLICPQKAIYSESSLTGYSFSSKTNYGLMSHASLEIAAENTGKLVAEVRKNGKKLADSSQSDLILSDGPPGTGCPVISSITGVDTVLIITEPTVAGVHDLKRILELTKHFSIKTLIVINKADLNQEQVKEIQHVSHDYHALIVGQIPFDKTINQALMNHQCILDYKDSVAAIAIQKLWENLIKINN